MLWSLSAADEHGYAIDRSRLKKWRVWSIDIRSFVKPAQRDDLETASTLAANIDTLNTLLLGIPAKTEADTTGEVNPAPSNGGYIPDHKPSCQRVVESTRHQENNSSRTNPTSNYWGNRMGSHWAVGI
jgi:hypothetical protein